MHELDTLYDTYETFVGELKDANEKIRQAGGKPSVGDLEVLDTISHGIKSTKTTIAMIESEAMDNSSRGYYDDMSMRSRNGRSRDGRSYDGRSYDGGGGMSGARGRGDNARRDSMGRYSRGDETEEELLDKLMMIRNRR